MSFFASLSRSVLGAASGLGTNGAAKVTEDVDRLCDRLASSSLVSDRREAVADLKALAKTNRLEVGTQALGPLIAALRRDRSDPELCCAILETMASVVEIPTGQGEKDDDAAAIATRSTEALAKRQDNISLIMEIVEEYSFQVRWATVKLLTALIAAKAARMQECILACPMGVSRLMDLLSDSREIIRNDALLLLKELTRGNDQVQGIVAFESGFDRILDIIAEEGASDGGIVTEDCIDLLSNLLLAHSRNQTLFLEGNQLQKLLPFFSLEKPEDGAWPAQKVSNLVAMLKVLRCLVTPSGSLLPLAQRTLASSRLLLALCGMMLSPGLQLDVLTEAIGTVAECIRGCAASQSAFANVQVQVRGGSPPCSAVLSVIMSLVSEKQCLRLRLATLYCLQAFLLDNQASQKHLVASMLPGNNSGGGSGVSAGALLCGGLMSADPLVAWCSGAALCSVVVHSAQKEALLDVHIGMAAGGAPVALLPQTAVLACSRQLSLTHRLACFSLLCCWLHECPRGIAALIRSGSALRVLVSGLDMPPDAGDKDEAQQECDRVLRNMMAFLLGICILYEPQGVAEESVRHALLQRHSADYVVEAISNLAQSEVFLRAGRGPQPRFDRESDVLYSYQLVSLYRQTVDDITAKVRGKERSRPEGTPPPSPAKSPSQAATAADVSTQQEHEAVLLSYKELIRQQDGQISTLKQQLQGLSQECDRIRQERDALANQLEQRTKELQDFRQPAETAGHLLHSSTEMAQELQELRHNMAMMQEASVEWQNRVAGRDERIAMLEDQLRQHHHQQQQQQQQQRQRQQQGDSARSASQAEPSRQPAAATVDGDPQPQPASAEDTTGAGDVSELVAVTNSQSALPLQSDGGSTGGPTEDKDAREGRQLQQPPQHPQQQQQPPQQRPHSAQQQMQAPLPAATVGAFSSPQPQPFQWSQTTATPTTHLFPAHSIPQAQQPLNAQPVSAFTSQPPLPATVTATSHQPAHSSYQQGPGQPFSAYGASPIVRPALPHAFVPVSGQQQAQPAAHHVPPAVQQPVANPALEPFDTGRLASLRLDSSSPEAQY
ncbi:general vesicular transport factor p115-like [Sycon ciliatum]|uniref:general vesicular transport factor p115-like n=1 Tax=Sycon ciliatum TaxID=27933 RepID=UPI0031F63520